jgi:hypothetical protein
MRMVRSNAMDSPPSAWSSKALIPASLQLRVERSQHYPDQDYPCLLLILG